MYVDRNRATRELVRVCKPGGYVADHEGYLVPEIPDSVYEANKEFMPGMVIEDAEAWLELYRSAGLTNIEHVSGSAEVPGPANMIRDEGISGFLKILGRLLTHPGYIRQTVKTVPRMKRVAPYLDHVVLAGQKPASSAG